MTNYIIGYAAGYHQNLYKTVEEVEEITKEEFIKKCKDIIKEHYPTRYIYLEHITKGLIGFYRNNKLIFFKY